MPTVIAMLSRLLHTSRPTLRCYSSVYSLLHARNFHTPGPSRLPENATSTRTSTSSEDARTTHFGFQTVPESEKQSLVASVFSSVASSYDTMNDLMSLSVHRLWKDHFVRSLLPFSPDNPTLFTNDSTQGLKVLDMAGGTGDIAFRLLSHPHTPRNTTVTVADINPSMLSSGEKRASAQHPHLLPHLSFLETNAESLPLPSNSIDMYTVAFGIRNFTNKPAALREAHRVLRPGGVFACLEFSTVTNPVFNALYKRWSFSMIPLIGQLVAGDRDSYQYLVESIEKFPDQETWKNMIADAGFLIPEGKGWEDLSGGIAAIHKGVKPV